MSALKKLVRSRMQLTGESYVTALGRIRECDGRLQPGEVEDRAKESTVLSPPRKGPILQGELDRFNEAFGTKGRW